MGQTYNFEGHYGTGSNIAEFTGTADDDDVLIATFTAESSGAGLVTDFTEHADGSFTATYRTLQSGSVDSVTISGIENVHIFTTNTYIFEGNTFHQATPDVVRTGRGDDIVSTYYGNDLIDSGLGIDQVDGGDGIDGLAKDFGSASAAVNLNLYLNTFSGPGSFTNIEYFTSLKTGRSNDRIDTQALTSSGAVGDDTVETRGGDDIVTVRDGQDTVDLGSGNDRLVVDWREATFTNNTFMTLSTGASGYSGSFAGTQSNAPSVAFSNVEHFTIYTMLSGGNGTNLQDDIHTGDGNDIVYTYASNDSIYVGRGVDRVDGGVGVDGLAKEFGTGSTPIVFNLYANTFSGPGSYENLDYFIDLKTGNGNDRIDTGLASSGLLGDDFITTRGGNDVVTVRNGQDTVNLGAGNDRLIIDWREGTFSNNTSMTLNDGANGYSGSFAGAQTNAPAVTFSGVESFEIYTLVAGGNGTNLADSIVTGDGDDIVYTYASSDTVFAGGGDDLVDGGVKNDSLNGGAGDDTLLGGDQNDTLLGGDGADELRGGTGNDFMVGGIGNDRYFVDSGADVVSEDDPSAAGGTDTMFSTVSWTLGANTEILRLQGSADIAGSGNALNNKIYGNTGANLLQGFAGDDTIEGRDGADTIDGGEGNDTLSGGSQADVFRFAASNAGVDRILDFSKNGDRFDLSGGTFTAISTAANGDAVLTHAGGAVRIASPPNLTLAQWNALVLPSGFRVAADGATPFSDGAAADSRIAHTESALHLHHGDWTFA